MPDTGSINVPAIVLAGGMSKRMRRNKLLLDLHGKPVLHWVLEALQTAGMSQIYVVTGHQAEAVQECCIESAVNVTTIHNQLYESGRASSVQAGLGAIGDTAPGVLITPGDVPFIGAELVIALQTEFEKYKRITFPTVQGKKGHPVIFPSSAFPLLQGLDGDETLHDYMLTNPDQTAPHAWGDAYCLMDVDTPESLAELKKKAPQRRGAW